MIDGITIVSEYTKSGSSAYTFLATELFLLFVIVRVIIFAIPTIKDFKRLYSKIILVVVVFIALCLVGYVMYTCFCKHQTIEKYYIVEIDDNVSLNEFQKNYEIIEENDGLYTIQVLD